ncbi:haloacid dehalogenase [Stutzerimonas stutzeri]|jgi:FMN phosphatase YigB (HAD superfamily)|nr:HAD family hydrolase [Stutzerimonas kunmingensis]KKJ96744.1 haloacid dehalogenase [Stutzerimonas stutzeri]MBU0922185.1 HAD family hydrolase [Gammaproteobacteria bacterium]|tara:strand:- start:990 stop:1622 length:633 start_codon:yes stop_codon:yes gene_type:complete
MIQAVVFDVFGTLLQIGERRHPFRQLMQHLRLQGRTPRPDDARTLMTRNLGLAGAADYFGAQLSNSELASLESDLFTELASVRLFDDALKSLNQLKNAGLKLALCSNLAAPYAIPAKLLLPSFDVYGWSFEVGTIKPEPAIYRQMIEQLGCEASAIAMIGDTLQADMLGPIGQGMRGYHLQREGKADQCGFVSLMDFAAHVLQYPPSAIG